MFTPSFVPLYLKPVPVSQRRLRKIAKCTLTPPTEEQPERPEHLEILRSVTVPQLPQGQPQLLPQAKFTPAIPRKQSLPTHRERLYLQSLHFTRPKGRAHRYARAQNLTLRAWPLIYSHWTDSEEPLHPLQPIPPWAYIVRVRASKSVFGKRAVVRNRAKRRLKAAAARIMPGHAKRGWEYVFTPSEGILEADFEALVDEVEECLRSVGAWKDELSLEEVVREVYCDRYR